VVEGAGWYPALLELDALGCDANQGYYIGRPVAADAFVQWLQRQHVPSTPVEAVD
jgi:EAL domain-containing protein (putative c-di-GMP-specific phosphodiesterase class I)